MVATFNASRNRVTSSSTEGKDENSMGSFSWTTRIMIKTPMVMLKTSNRSSTGVGTGTISTAITTTRAAAMTMSACLILWLGSRIVVVGIFISSSDYGSIYSRSYAALLPSLSRIFP